MNSSPASGTRSVRIGVDIGGTFTDIVLALPDGTLLVSKVSSTPDDPGRGGGRAASARCCARPACAPADVVEIVHGTTVGVEHDPAEERARAPGSSPRAASATCWRSAASARRTCSTSPGRSRCRWCRAACGSRCDERIAADGAVVAAARSRRACSRRPSGSSREGVEVDRDLLHQQLRQPGARARGRAPACARAIPGLDVTASYARAAGDQGVRAHQHHGGERLSAAGDAPLPRRPRRRPAAHRRRRRRCWSSPPTAAWWARRRRPRGRSSRSAPGPAAGVVGAARLGAGDRRRANLIAFDMGGTTAKASLVEDGRVVAHVRVRVPRGHQHVEPLHQGGRLHAEGAGHRHRRGRRGRRLDRLRSTRAGCCASGRSRRAPTRARPATASAATRPTVTDANVVLGFLNPDAPRRRRAAAATRERAREADRAATSREPLGLLVLEAAHGIRAGGQRQHGARDPRGDHRARARPARLHAGRLRRQRPACTPSTWRARSTSAACSCPSRRACSPRSACWRATSSTTSCARSRRAWTTLEPLASCATRLDELDATRRAAALAPRGYAERARGAAAAQADLRYAGQASRADRCLCAPRTGRRAPAAAARRFLAAVPRHLRLRTDEPVELVNLRLVGRGSARQRARLRGGAASTGAPARPSAAAGRVLRSRRRRDRHAGARRASVDRAPRSRAR